MKRNVNEQVKYFAGQIARNLDPGGNLFNEFMGSTSAAYETNDLAIRKLMKMIEHIAYPSPRYRRKTNSPTPSK